jgi:RNA polymerase sigma-70 factor (ECF subfamily)
VTSATPDITTLVEQHSHRIYQLALRLTRNRADAEDVLQETFLTVMRKLDTFEGRSEVYTWMHRIATNIALGKLRSQKREVDVDISADDFDQLAAWHPVQGVPPVQEREDSEVLRQALDTAIAHLPEHHRVVFLLRDVEGFSTQETAEMLDLTPANVKVRLMRARIQLRNELAELGYPDPDRN